MMSATLLLSTVLLAASAPARADDPPAFELLDGDHVVFVGNTFIERDQVYGYLETMLIARWPDRNITFRNLGWSGDTVWGEARARFGTAAVGFQHLKDHVETLKPTVIFVGYGANETFEGDTGLPRFEKGLNDLLDMLATASALNVRIVLMSPLQHERLQPPLPDPTRHNEDVRKYAEAIRRIARDRQYRFVDLTGIAGNRRAVLDYLRLTDNGVHLTNCGYLRIAEITMKDLGLAATDPWSVVLDQTGARSQADRARFLEFEEKSGTVRFKVVADTLPGPFSEKCLAEDPFPSGNDIPISGFIDNKDARPYRVLADGKPAGRLEPRVLLTFPTDQRQVEQLRQAIIEKNRLYFHRWRPQNETYLFGFRKHEQGQNAAEVPKFDPLVEELEAKIAKLRVPVKHTYEIIRVSEDKRD